MQTQGSLPQRQRTHSLEQAVDVDDGVDLANAYSTVSSGDTYTGGSHVLTDPTVTRLHEVFPDYFASAVVRIPAQGTSTLWHAGLTMTFLNSSLFGSKIGCMTSINIVANRVQRIAKQLFDIDVEISGADRYLTTTSGLRIIPSPDFVLRGALRSQLAEVLGSSWSTAIKSSPAYQEDERRGEPRAEVLSMTISHRALDPGVLNITVDEKSAFRLKNMLFGDHVMPKRL